MYLLNLLPYRQSMNWKLLLLFTAIVAFVSCGKDKFQTKPQIKTKSVNGNVLPVGADLIMNLEFTDKEGDLGQGKLVFIPKRLNKRPLPPSIPPYDSIVNILPDFPKKNQGELEIRLQWNYLHKSDIENDTIYFRFVAVDRAGNKSDTLDSEKFVILRQ